MPSRRLRNTVRQNLIRQDHVLRQELLDEMLATGKEMQLQYKRITARWTHKPKFNIETEISIRIIRLTILPETNNLAGKIFNWIDRGTGKFGKRGAPYEIKPKPGNLKGVLRFRRNYTPKTAPVAQFGGPGIKGGPWVSKKRVLHPGIEARRFTEVLLARMTPPLKRRIDNAIRRAVRRAARA